MSGNNVATYTQLHAKLVRAEERVQQLEAVFQSLCDLWEPVDAYTRRHSETKLGESVVVRTLEMLRERDALAAELQKLREQEPVAWRYQDARGNHRYRGYVPNFDIDFKRLKPVPLYAAPIPAPAVPAPTPFIPDDDTRRNDAEFAAQQAATAPSVPEEWRAAMQEAHDTFQRYADLHRAKDTRDGYEKARPNQKLANKLYALLQATNRSEGECNDEI